MHPIVFKNAKHIRRERRIFERDKAHRLIAAFIENGHNVFVFNQIASTNRRYIINQKLP